MAAQTLRIDLQSHLVQVPEYLGAGARHFGFMLRSLRLTADKFAALGIPFFMLRGDPGETIPQLVKDCGASLLVVDYGPLRGGRQWRDKARPGVAAGNAVPSHTSDRAKQPMRPRSCVTFDYHAKRQCVSVRPG